MLEHGFVCCKSEPCLFVKTVKGQRTYVMIHVDDALIVGSRSSVDHAKVLMKSSLDLRDIGPARFFLGLEISKKNDGGYKLTQRKYISDILLKFGMENSQPKSTPLPVGKKHTKQPTETTPYLPDDNRYAELVGSLLYLSVNSRPDICHSVGVLTRFMSAPTLDHWESGKRILRYLKGTSDFGLKFPGPTKNFSFKGFLETMILYSDADHCADIDKRRSTSGVLLMMHNTAVLW